MSVITYEGYLFEQDSEEIASLRKRCIKTKKRKEKRCDKKSALYLAIWAAAIAVSTAFPQLIPYVLLAASSVNLVLYF